MIKDYHLIKDSHLRRITFGLGCSLPLLGTSCLALQTYPFVDQQSTKVIISKTEQNRIDVLGDRIQQVFGAEGTFDVESDEDGGQIFLITAKHGFSLEESPSVIKPMTITIITETGLTQDLKLSPKNIEAQSILFKPTLTLNEEPQEKHLQQVIKLLKAMVKNEELEGYTRTSLEKDSSPGSLRTTPFKSLKVTDIATYKGARLIGKIYTLQNQGKEALSLKESDFVLHQEVSPRDEHLQDESHQDVSHRDVALSLSKSFIHEGETILLYVVTRECTQECARRPL